MRWVSLAFTGLMLAAPTNAIAEPSNFAVRQAASQVGCSAMNPDIRKISQSNESVNTQYVYQVECDAIQGTYVIVVCRGSFDCRAE
jgi:hypothetical protein